MLLFEDTDHHLFDEAIKEGTLGSLLGGKPFISFSVDPSSLGGSTPNGEWCFKDDELKYYVGSAFYQHAVLDLNHDEVAVYDVPRKMRSHGGLSRAIWKIRNGSSDLKKPAWTYKLQRVRVDALHSVVVGIPVVESTVKRFVMLPGPRLSQRRVTEGQFNVMDVLCEGKRFRQICVNGSADVTQVEHGKLMSLSVLVEQMSKGRAGFIRQSLGLKRDIQSEMIRCYLEQGYQDASLMTLNEGLKWRSDGMYVFGTLDEDMDSGMRMFMPPLFSNAFVASLGVENERRTVQSRVLDVTNDTEPGREYYKFAEEFVEFIFDGRELVPLTYDELWELASPKLRRRMDRSLYLKTTSSQVLPAFQKVEAHIKVKPPRNITNVNDDQVIEMARYMYPLSQRLKEFGWYVFGSTPSEIEERVFEIAQRSHKIGAADFKKFDGHRSRFIALVLENGVLRKLFGDRVIRIYDNESRRKARTKHGVRYFTGWSRLSGSAATSVMNTIVNGFVAYCAFRISGHSAEAAWFKLCWQCSFGGDDSLVGDLDDDAHVRAAQCLGFKLETQTCEYGEHVEYLGRIWVNPWVSRANMINVKRQGKLHMCRNVKISDEEMMRLKATAILQMDHNTPILTNWAKSVIRRLGPVSERLVKKLERFEISMPNEWLRRTMATSDETFTAPSDDVAYEVVSKITGMTIYELNRFCEALDKDDRYRFRKGVVFDEEEVPADVQIMCEGEFKMNGNRVDLASPVSTNLLPLDKWAERVYSGEPSELKQWRGAAVGERSNRRVEGWTGVSSRVARERKPTKRRKRGRRGGRRKRSDEDFAEYLEGLLVPPNLPL